MHTVHATCTRNTRPGTRLRRSPQSASAPSPMCCRTRSRMIGAMTMTEQKSGVVRSKEFHFPVDVDWVGERRVAAHVVGKLPIEITPPPEFRGTDPSTWSPEDLFVAAAASCLAVTFTGLAQRAGLAYSSLDVNGDGVAGTRSDRRFAFTRLVLEFEVAVAPGDE